MCDIFMSLIEKYDLLKESIECSALLSSGQKKILIHLAQFEKGVAMSVLVDLMGQSKQALYFNVKKLLERGFISRERGMVYVYRISEDKITDLIESYKQLKKAKSFT
jgi:DNA-binding MarR family transcriptional regulator